MTVIINLPNLPVQRLDSVATIALLRAIPSASLTDGQDIAVDGTAAVGDGGGGLFVWSELSVENDDGVTVIRPDTVPPLAAGRWVLTAASAFTGAFSGDGGAGLIGFDNEASYPADTVGNDLQSRAYRDLNNVTNVNSTYTLDGSFTPVGNGALTRGWWNVRLADQHDDEREFLCSWGADFRHGGGGDPTYQWDKVLHYAGVTFGGNARCGWVRNDLMHINPDAANIQYINGYELDINNERGSFGAAIGAAGIPAPSIHGMTIAGSSSLGYTITSGLCLISASPLSAPLFERGFMVGPFSAKQAAFDDYSSATASYRDQGAHTYGIDLGGTYSGGAIRMPNNVPMVGKTVGGVSSLLIAVSGTDELVLGDATNHVNIIANRTILPSVDNIWQLGATGMRFSSVWATNGAIQTSDARYKKNIADVDPGKVSAVFDALDPKSWTWTVGGRKPIMGTEMQEVQTGTERKMIPMMQTVGKRTDKDADGNDIEVPVREMVDVPVDVPTLETKPVPVVTGYEDIPGKRTHFGFLAGDVKAAIDAAGIGDFGGYVLGEDGTEAIRPDQIMALMFVEIKSLRARVAALEAN